MRDTIQLLVTEPCHESWNTMTPDEKGRFCPSCQKTVTDFTHMTDKQLLEYIASSDAPICGRFNNGQLSRDLVTDSNKRNAAPYVLNFLAATLLTAGYADAQEPGPKTPTSKQSLSKSPLPANKVKGEERALPVQAPHWVNGIVLDTATMMPVPAASLQWGNEFGGVAADGEGRFQLPFIEAKPKYNVTISALGYKTQEFLIKRDTSGLVTFYLEKQSDVLDTVFVNGINDMNRRDVTVGLLVVRKQVSYKEKAKRKFDDWTTGVVKNKELRIYPNPISPGAIVEVDIAVKETGTYTLEIMDEKGHVLHRQLIQMKSTKQQLQVATSTHWSRGIYWVRVFKAGNNKPYNVKLVIQ